MVELERMEEQQKNENEIVQPMVQELYNPSIHLPSAPTNWNNYEPSTPITETLIALIGVSGRPISTADFMRIALTHPQHGYYTNAITTKHNHHHHHHHIRDTATSTSLSTDAKGQHRPVVVDDFDVNDWDTDTETKSTATTTANSTTTTTTNTVIGADFVTAPEISHVFGECIGVWFATQWQQQQQQQLRERQFVEFGIDTGKSHNNNNNNKYTNEWQWLELGPGKGTLMVDLLRFTLQLSSAVQTNDDNHNSNNEIINDETPMYFGDGCKGIHFVERSPIFRRQQRDLLEQTFHDQADLQFEFSGIESGDDASTLSPAKTITTLENIGTNSKHTSKRIIQVVWHDTFEDFVRYSENEIPVPNETTLGGITPTYTTMHHRPTFIVGQEFLDALPVYSFEKASEGFWRERLVDVAVREDLDDDDEKQNRVGHEVETDAKPVMKDISKEAAALNRNPKPRLRIVLAPEVTPPLKTLLNTDDEGYLMSHNDNGTTPIGSVIEVCPEAILLVQDVAKYIKQQSGSAALFIDYGSNMGSYDSLRGYSQHEQVPFISLPGQVDITADVDFAAMKHAINHVVPFGQPLLASYNDLNAVDDTVVRAFGPVTQGAFLMSMGIQERIINLIERDDVSEEQAQNLFRALVRLASPEEMGERYKVLAIAATTNAAKTADGEIVYNTPAGF